MPDGCGVGILPASDRRSTLRDDLATGARHEELASINRQLRENSAADDSVIPRFRIPTANDGEGLALEPALDQLSADSTVRVLPHGVEPRLRHKNQKIMAAGHDLELPVVRDRQRRAG